MHKIGPKTTIKDLTENDKDWQELRKSLVGTWKKTPVENVAKLKKYMGGSVKSATNEQLLIVLNYLTGTGFRTGKIKHISITLFRNQIKAEIAYRRKNDKWRK